MEHNPGKDRYPGTSGYGQKGELGRKILSGIGWNAGQLMADGFFSFAVKLILARILIPQHFGIIGMAVVFTGLVQMTGDIGLGAPLIQARRRHLSAVHYSTVFWFSIAANILLFALLAFVAGPFAAWFYGEPVLRGVIPVIGISLLLSPLTLVQRSMLTRDMKFRALGMAQVASHIAAGIFSIALALAGMGVWSLALQGVAASFIQAPILWRFAGWKPARVFSSAALKELISKGGYEAGTRLFSYATKNLDYLLVGRMLGAAPLGFYTLAFTVTDIFRQKVMGVLGSVMFPVYGRLQDSPPAMKTHYLRVVRYNLVLLLPFMIPLLFFAGPIVALLPGEEWLPAVFPLQAMAVASVIHAAGGTTDSVLKGMGRFGLCFRIHALKTVFITLPLFLLLIPLYGINGAAAAVVIHKFASRVIFQYHMKKLIGVGEKDILSAARVPAISFAASLPAVLAVKMAPEPAGIPALALSLAFPVAAFAACAFYMLRGEIKTLLAAGLRR